MGEKGSTLRVRELKIRKDIRETGALPAVRTHLNAGDSKVPSDTMRQYSESALLGHHRRSAIVLKVGPVWTVGLLFPAI